MTSMPEVSDGDQKFTVRMQFHIFALGYELLYR